MRTSVMLLGLLSFATTSALSQEPPADTIVTKDGQLVILQVQESDRFPPDCATPRTISCRQVRPGFKIVVIWLGAVDSSKTEPVSSALMHSFKEIQIVADDGKKTEAYSGGMVDRKLFVAFTPPANARVQGLAWPGNPLIELARP